MAEQLNVIGASLAQWCSMKSLPKLQRSLNFYSNSLGVHCCTTAASPHSRIGSHCLAPLDQSCSSNSLGVQSCSLKSLGVHCPHSQIGPFLSNPILEAVHACSLKSLVLHCCTRAASPHFKTGSHRRHRPLCHRRECTRLWQCPRLLRHG